MAAPYALELRDLAPPAPVNPGLGAFVGPEADGTVWRYTNVEEPAAAYADAAPGTPMALLAPFRVVKSVPEAVEYLGEVLEPLQLLGLFRHYFPEEYRAALESGQQLFRKGGQTYSPAECRFLALVDARLFSLPDWFLDYGWVEDREGYIPFQDHGVDWWDTDIGDFRVGVRFLIMLGGFARIDPSEATLDDYLEETMEGEAVLGVPRDIVEQVNELPGLEPRLFEALSELERDTPEPLRYLCQSFEIIDHSTGNVWFDTHGANVPLYARWSRESVDMLAREWAEAAVMEDRFGKLLDWLEADPEHMREAVNQYEAALEETVEMTDDDEGNGEDDHDDGD